MNEPSQTSTYGWGKNVSHCHSYIDPAILDAVRSVAAKKIMDLGCGNGTLCGYLHAKGFAVEGCEPDAAGVITARQSFPDITFHQTGVYDDPKLPKGSFDVVVSTEVIEHLYAPEYLPQFARKVLAPGGHLIVSTPYHGYLKNVLISLLGKWDFHHHPASTGRHIKFWSRQTLTAFLSEHGFTVRQFIGVGRVRWLWKAMILVAQLNEQPHASS